MGALGLALDALATAAAAVGGVPWGANGASASFALVHARDARALRRALAEHADEIAHDDALLARARLAATAILRARVLRAAANVRDAQRTHAARARALLHARARVWPRLGAASPGTAETAAARAQTLASATDALLAAVALLDAHAHAVRCALTAHAASSTGSAALARALRAACAGAAALLRAARGAPGASVLAARVADAVRASAAALAAAAASQAGDDAADAAAPLGRFLRHSGATPAARVQSTAMRIAPADVRRTLEAVRDELSDGGALGGHVDAAVAAGERALLARAPVWWYAEVTVGGAAAVRAVATRTRALGGSGELEDTAVALSGAVCRFTSNNIVSPATNLYRQVFRNELPSQTSTASVATARHTLRTMLKDFTDAHLRNVPGAVHAAEKGDLAAVMDYYARLARRPLGSFVFGDMAQAMLLQVQKLKCDVEELIVKSRHTLQAQELNLALVALVPACGVVAAAVYAASSALARWRRRGTHLVVSPEQTLRFLLGDVHAALVALRDDTHDADDALSPLRRVGELALGVFEVREFVESGVIQAPPKVVEKFLDDVEGLECADASYDARVLCIQKMWSVYPFFLNPHVY